VFDRRRNPLLRDVSDWRRYTLERRWHLYVLATFTGAILGFSRLCGCGRRRTDNGTEPDWHVGTRRAAQWSRLTTIARMNLVRTQHPVRTGLDMHHAPATAWNYRGSALDRAQQAIGQLLLYIQAPNYVLRWAVSVGWLSGRTSVSDRRTFTGLHRPG